MIAQHISDKQIALVNKLSSSSSRGMPVGRCCDCQHRVYSRDTYRALPHGKVRCNDCMDYRYMHSGT